MSRLRRALRRVRLELLRARAAAMKCPDCSHRNVIAVDDDGFAQCTHCGHKLSADLFT